jgi:glycylpeptide N-tetradecanoyltransferase
VLEAAYLFYYATDTAFLEDAEAEGRLKTRLQQLIGDALIVAHQAKFDVFNALTLMDNVPVLKELKVRDTICSVELSDIVNSLELETDS